MLGLGLSGGVRFKVFLFILSANLYAYSHMGLVCTPHQTKDTMCAQSIPKSVYITQKIYVNICIYTYIIDRMKERERESAPD